MIIRGHVLRQNSTALGTPGRLTLENGFGADTLELAWHDNERGRSCTAPGVDRGRVWFSPTLMRLVIRFEDRNGRQNCLIHNGNWAADAADLDGDGVIEVTQVHGCTEVGSGYGDIERKDGKKQWGIARSKVTLAALIESIRDGSPVKLDEHGYASGYHGVEITYEWAEGCAP